jgi:hypothetical protein
MDAEAQRSSWATLTLYRRRKSTPKTTTQRFARLGNNARPVWQDVACEVPSTTSAACTGEARPTTTTRRTETDKPLLVAVKEYFE